MTDDIPDLTSHQREAVREFTSRYRDESEGRVSINPVLLARVLARDKPAAQVYISGETHPDFDNPDAYLYDLCSTFDLHMKNIKEARGWAIGRSRWRLDLLPTRFSETDAYHRRCGFVYGYPASAIEDFIETTTNITNCDLVRAGIFSAEDVAYLIFVSYHYHNSLKRYEERIEIGKQIRQRLTQLAEVWSLPILDEYATLLHNDVAEAYRGNATWNVPTTFHPEKTVSRSDVLSLLS